MYLHTEHQGLERLIERNRTYRHYIVGFGNTPPEILKKFKERVPLRKRISKKIHDEEYVIVNFTGLFRSKYN